MKTLLNTRLDFTSMHEREHHLHWYKVRYDDIGGISNFVLFLEIIRNNSVHVPVSFDNQIRATFLKSTTTAT